MKVIASLRGILNNYGELLYFGSIHLYFPIRIWGKRSALCVAVSNVGNIRAEILKDHNAYIWAIYIEDTYRGNSADQVFLKYSHASATVLNYSSLWADLLNYQHYDSILQRSRKCQNMKWKYLNTLLPNKTWYF